MENLNKVSRSNTQVSHIFLLENPRISLFFGLVSIFSSIASFLGLLRWKEPIFTYSFSILSVVFAIYCLERAIRGFKLLNQNS